MKTKFFLPILLSFFLGACGGNKDSAVTEEIRSKIADAPDNLALSCDLFDNDNFVSTDTNIVYADEVISASCDNDNVANYDELVLDNIGFFKNIETLVLGTGHLYPGKLDGLVNLKRLRELRLIGYYDHDNTDPDMWSKLNIESLAIIGTDIGYPDISDIGKIKSLKVLYLEGSPSGIDDLSGLSNLEELYINSGYADLTSISELTALKKLSIRPSPAVITTSLVELSDGLPALPFLKELVLQSVKNTDLSIIEKYDSLESLTIEREDVSTLRCGKTLTNVKVLDGTMAKFDETCSDIIQLDIISSDFTATSLISNLKKIQRLNLSFNRISDISDLVNLTTLKELHLSSNSLEDITPLANLDFLEYLDISFNKINDLSPLYSMIKLKTLYLMHNDELSIDEVNRLKKVLPSVNIISKY